MDAIESVALDQVDIIERLIRMNRELIEELSQHRRIDEEEKELEDLVRRMGRL
jgi:hypothetical protein